MLFSYDPIMVASSVLVAIMASFTGLRLAGDLSALPVPARRLRIAEAACALGGGIWSMHFVGMLALRLPVSISYDALHTLSSVLVSILITGLGLSFVHTGKRTLWRTAVSGTLIGLGIVTMHYIGMRAIGAEARAGEVARDGLRSPRIAAAAGRGGLHRGRQPGDGADPRDRP